jgi:2Fe-2S ferredoxin
MATFIFVSKSGEGAEIEATPRASAMRSAVVNGLDGILDECGSSLACGAYHVYVAPSQLARLPPASPTEDEMLE